MNAFAHFIIHRGEVEIKRTEEGHIKLIAEGVTGERIVIEVNKVTALKIAASLKAHNG